jgi:hypothetical protein
MQEMKRFHWAQEKINELCGDDLTEQQRAARPAGETRAQRRARERIEKKIERNIRKQTA